MEEPRPHRGLHKKGAEERSNGTGTKLDQGSDDDRVRAHRVVRRRRGVRCLRRSRARSQSRRKQSYDLHKHRGGGSVSGTVAK
jgi:hypothetical protein